jgi:Dna[CI] antecedent, DciA
MTRKKGFFRVPKNYQGTSPTSRNLSEVLPFVLDKINDVYQERPDLILAAWPKVIGEQLSPMTRAVSFHNHVLLVHVNNSTLLSLLSRHEKDRLLMSLKEMFPLIEIRDIFFRMGS